MKALAALAAAGLVAGAAAGVAAADPTAAAPAAAAPGKSKKEQLLADKVQARRPPAAERERWGKELRRRMRQKPPVVVNVYNTWTHESVAVDVGARASAPAAQLVDRFLRCHFTDHRTAMDPRLFGVLMKAASAFKVARVEIVSGFRAPKYNLMLRKKGHFVARNSEHTFGHAVDFRLPGVTTERLRNWARRLRMGGVGYYHGDGFVHVDTGPVRYWAE